MTPELFELICGPGSRHYYLDGHTPKKITTIEQFTKAWEPEARRIAQDHIGNISISTVFLVLDHSWSGGPPILFETMIFGGIYSDYQNRYVSYDQALMGHRQAVLIAKHGSLWSQRLKYFFTGKKKYEEE